MSKKEQIGQFTVSNGKSINQIIIFETHLPDGDYQLYVSPCQKCASGILCADCLDTGWLENREEGRYPCTCITEMEPYQLLQAKCSFNIQELIEKQKYILQLEKEVVRLKVVPMIYRRMAFNAQLQDENSKLIAKCSSLENSLEQTSITLGNWIERYAELEVELNSYKQAEEESEEKT